MFELLRSELFGTANGTAVQYLFTFLFMVYPFISLPVLYHLWKKAERRKSGGRAGTVRLQRRKVAQGGAPARPRHGSDVPATGEQAGLAAGRAAAVRERRSSGASALVDGLVKLVENGSETQRLTAATLLADLGHTASIDALMALDDELSRPAGTRGGSGGTGGTGRPVHLRLVKTGSPREDVRTGDGGVRDDGKDRDGEIIEAARLLALAAESPAGLRAAALDFLVDYSRDRRPCRRKTASNRP